ncbi:MAG: hypothetical protein WCY10_05975 [Candidatus Omnitrophota bacterium]
MIIFLLCAPSAWSADDDSQVYEAALTQLLRAGGLEASEEQIQRLNEARQEFQKFADDRPGSVYADDSRFVYSLIEFMGALMVPPRDMADADRMISLMDSMARAYPDGKIEESTYSILRRELGDQAVGGAFYIPYSHIVEYMRALKAGQTRDYRNAIAGYVKLKDELALTGDENIAWEICVPLYIAYARSGKNDDAQALVDEVSQAYPGSQLESVMTAMNDKKNKKDND